MLKNVFMKNISILDIFSIIMFWKLNHSSPLRLHHVHAAVQRASQRAAVVPRRLQAYHQE
jgi:hypothetical protein